MLEKLSSRKFWVTVVTMLGVVGGDQLLELPLPVLILIAVAGCTYVAAQALVDALLKPTAPTGGGLIRELVELASSPTGAPLLELATRALDRAAPTVPDEENVQRTTAALVAEAKGLPSAVKVDPNVLTFIAEVLRMILPFLFRRRS